MSNVGRTCLAIPLRVICVILTVRSAEETAGIIDQMCRDYVQLPNRPILKMLLSIAGVEQLFADEFVYEAFAKIKSLKTVIYTDNTKECKGKEKADRPTLDVDIFLHQVLEAMPSRFHYAAEGFDFAAAC
mgnify:CR=1 FL=1